MNRLNYIAVLAMLEADRPTREQWEALLSMYRDADEDNHEAKEEMPVKASPVARPQEEPQNLPQLMTRAQAAEYLGTTVATLSTWACTRAVKVPYVKIGGSVRYRRRALDAWLDSQVVGGE